MRLRLLTRGGAADNLAMTITEDVVTRATPEKAWSSSPIRSLHTLWNPRIVRTEPSSADDSRHGPALAGVTYEMSGKSTTFDASVIEFESPSRWVARLEESAHGTGDNFGRYMEESYTLTRSGDRTRVHHRVVIHHSGVNVRPGADLADHEAREAPG